MKRLISHLSHMHIHIHSHMHARAHTQTHAHANLEYVRWHSFPNSSLNKISPTLVTLLFSHSPLSIPQERFVSLCGHACPHIHAHTYTPTRTTYPLSGPSQYRWCHTHGPLWHPRASQSWESSCSPLAESRPPSCADESAGGTMHSHLSACAR
jgi:hypothetical protein